MIRKIGLSKKLKKKRHHSVIGTRGFSLLELVVGLGVSAAAVVAAVSVFATLTRSYTTQNACASVQQVVRAGVDHMVQNIRMAGLNPAKIPNVGFISATPIRIEFTVDRNLNGTIDTSDEEHMAFSYDGALEKISEGLYIGSGSESWNSLVKNVTDLTFHYLDHEGNDLGATPDIAEIRTVEILLAVAHPAGSDRRGRVQRAYSTRIRCRNLGL
jgi:type IV pilus assembly protein PilW